MTSIATALSQAARRLAAHDSARLDAEVLLAHVLDKPRSHLHAWPERQLEPPALAAFERLVARRAGGEPVAHLTERREFWSLSLEVGAETLIPRPDTESLVEQALALLPPGEALRVADPGTGSGAIALALAHERPAWQLYALDRSEACVRIARRNAARLGLDGPVFLVGDWCTALADNSLDAIVCNPPYVAEGDPHLRQGDVRHEPPTALVSGADGLDDIRRLVADAVRVLRRPGHLLLEHAPGQQDAIHKILENKGFSNISTWRDLAGRARVTTGSRLA